MTKLALTGGSYLAASVEASCQRCLNLYPETIPEAQGETNPVTYYPTPGLTLLGTAPNNAAFRCLYRASNGDLFSVNDVNVYYISPAFVFTLVGSFNLNSGNPVIMSDNGINVIMCDGTAGVGFSFILVGHTGFAQITSAGWLGSTYVDYLDTFFLANFIGTPTFYISGSVAVTFDGSDFAGKSGKPDFLVAAVATHGVVWLIGTTETEVWYGGIVGLGSTTSGLSVNTFPFTPMDGVRMEDGCAAPYSIAKTDTNVFWLGQNTNGGRYVLQGSGYRTKIISTPAIESVFAKYTTISDCVAFCYMQRGHHFYVMNFPSADATWVYDLTTGLWHERCWLDTDGVEHRHRAGFHGFAYDKNIVGDWQNGNLYYFDPVNYLDNGRPIKKLRSFPVVMDSGDNNKIVFTQFVADIEVGTELVGARMPQIFLRWSDTRGITWSNAVGQDLGHQGDYLTNVSWNRLGMGRFRVFELEWSSSVKTALNGAYILYKTTGA